MRTMKILAGFCLSFLLAQALFWVWPASAQALQDYAESTGTAVGESAPEQAGKDESAVQLEFVGQNAFSERELLKSAAEELALLKDASHLGTVAEDAAFQMQMKYRLEGYAFASVGYAIDSAGPEKATLTFMITEGTRVHIEGIQFQGNSAIAAEQLLEHLSADGNGLSMSDRKIFVESALRGAISALKEYYYAKGFQEVEIAEPQLEFSGDKAQVDILISIIEGPQYKVQGLELAGEVLPDLTAQLENLTQVLRGQPYFPRRKLELRSAITEIYANLGYPDVRVEVSVREPGEKGAVILVADIAGGSQVRISRLIYSGNEKTQESFLESRIALKPGEVYSLERRRQSFQELYNTGLFSRIDMDLEPGAEGDQRALVVAVAEYPSKEIYADVGWGSYEFLRMRGGFRENNLGGNGRILKTEVGASFKSEDFLVKLTDPWFLGTKITADFPIFYQQREEPAYDRQDSGGSLMFSREFMKNIVFSGGYQYKRTSLSDIEIESAIAELENNYNLGSAKFQVAVDTRDDIFMPTSGFKLFFSEEYSDTMLGSDLQYLRSGGGARFFKALRPQLVLGVRLDTGLIMPFANQLELPLSERYYNGGENSVRSFRQDRLGPRDLSGDPVGGMGYNILSLEVRRNISRNFSMSLFGDMGNIAPNRSKNEEGLPSYRTRSELVNATLDDYFSDFRSAVGLGFQYLLPVGPARLDFALNPDREPARDEREYAVHFSIGMAF